MTPSPAPGQLQAVRHVENHRNALLAHHRKATHVDDQVVVAEARAALGDDDARITRGGDLRDGVLHVVGREELALLDVDDPTGLAPRRRSGRSGATGTRGSAGHRRPRRRSAASAASWMSVTIGTLNRRLIAASTRSPSVMPGPRYDLAEVRLALSYERLEDERDTDARRDVHERLGQARGVRLALDDARTGHQDDGMSVPHHHVAQRDRRHGSGHRLGGVALALLRPCACSSLRRTTRTADAASSAST